MQINIFFTNYFNEKIEDENILNDSLQKILVEISKEIIYGNKSGEVTDLCKDEYFIINAKYEIIEAII